MTGGKATRPGDSLGGIHPLNVHACSLITLVAQMPQEPRMAEGLSVKCAHFLHSVTFSHRPSLRGAQPLA